MSTSNTTEIEKAVVSFVGILATLAITITFRGFALTLLWRWFVVETFRLPSLSVPEALGIALIVAFLVPGASKANDQRFVLNALSSASYCAFVLLFGYCLAWLL